MMTRRQFIERNRRQIYGSQPTDDSVIGINLVNNWLSDAIAIAAKSNYTDALRMDGVAYVNNSFYTTFKNLSVVQNEQFTWQISLPDIPFGIGADEGISTLQFKDKDSNQISLPVVWLTQNQKTYYQGMRHIPNKTLAYSEGQFVYVLSTILLNQYTANVTMVSGGDSTDLDSILNVPSDYYPQMVEYLKKQLMFMLSVPVDRISDGEDVNPTA